jgi:hypothetical protein
MSPPEQDGAHVPPSDAVAPPPPPLPEAPSTEGFPELQAINSNTTIASHFLSMTPPRAACNK